MKYLPPNSQWAGEEVDDYRELYGGRFAYIQDGELTVDDNDDDQLSFGLEDIKLLEELIVILKEKIK